VATLWETTTGEKRGALTGHEEMIFDIAYSPDGRTVATASMDGTVRLWDALTQNEIGRLEGHRGWVVAVAFSPDGERLVSGGLDTTALVWDIRPLMKRQAKTVALSAAELQSCWEDLGLGAGTAYSAISKLHFSPKQAVAMLRERIKPAPMAEAQQIAERVGNLGSEQFKIREQAMLELEKLGEVAAPALQIAFMSDPPLEVKRRLEILLEKLSNWPVETLRQVRAVEVLEDIGTPDARAVLERFITEGAPEARLTREAEAAQRRLKKGSS
jgi:hypothetical protein